MKKERIYDRAYCLVNWRDTSSTNGWYDWSDMWRGKGINVYASAKVAQRAADRLNANGAQVVVVHGDMIRKPEAGDMNRNPDGKKFRVRKGKTGRTFEVVNVQTGAVVEGGFFSRSAAEECADAEQYGPVLEAMEAAGFDKSYITSDGVRIRCSQCDAMGINGTPVHELRCPNDARVRRERDAEEYNDEYDWGDE